MIKVSDYIVKRLEEQGVTQAFMISGGGAMHLNDSFGKSSVIRHLCNHHEQASAMAAEGYARASGRLPVVVVTSGPGSTNALTGVIGQWLDSVPCLYISGQVKQETMGAGTKGLRQLGDQEINIIDMVRPVTKYATTITDPGTIRFAMDWAVYQATHDRPGPVWIEVPLDVQAAMIETPKDSGFVVPPIAYNTKAAEVVELLKLATQPLLLVGQGVRISGAEKLFIGLAERTGIPVVTSFNGMDLVPSDHPLFAGRAGTIGTRQGNSAISNCDLLISIGTRNNIRQVSYDWQAFAPNAAKVVVDIDEAELTKPTLRPDVAVHADAWQFIKRLLFHLEGVALPDWAAWRASLSVPYCFTVVASRDGIDPYYFIRTLTDLLPDDAVIISGNGTASVCLHQSGVVKKGQRIIMNSGCAAMGYDLPAAIGACLAGVHRPSSVVPPVVCITGDGSVQMNIQELATIAHHRLPIKIFVLNNGGYHSIRQTQDKYFDGRHVGADHESGVSCPDVRSIAKAYGFPASYVDTYSGMEVLLEGLLAYSGPEICDVRLTQDYIFDKQSFESSSLRGVSGSPEGVAK